MDQNSVSPTNQSVTPNQQTQPVVTPPQPVVSMRDSEPEHHGMSKGMALIIGIVIFGLIGIVSYSLVRNSQQGSAQNTTPQGQQGGGQAVAKIDATKPSLLFDPTAADKTYQVGKPITIAVVANSQGADIYGYDIQFKVNPEQFEISEAVSLLENFDLTQYNRGEYYSITAIKDINDEQPSLFENTPIVSITLIPKTAGTITLEVLHEVKGETSKFTDKNVTVIDPQIQPLQLEIQ